MLKGIIYYASKKAQTDKLLKEGYTATISGKCLGTAVYLADNFVQIDFDTSGQNYIHMQLV